MLSWKNLCLGAALTASPLLMADEARGDHYRRGHYRPGCDVSRNAPSYHSSYRSGIGFSYTPRVYARPPISTPYGMRTPYGARTPYGVPGGIYRYGAGYPRYGTSGFSLYIGR